MDLTFTLRDYELEVTTKDARKRLQKGYSDFYYLQSQFPGTVVKAKFPAQGDDMVDWFDEFATRCPRDVLTTFLGLNTTRRAPGALVKTGYLTKLGGNKQGGTGNWKRRFMVLADHLEYYENEQAFLTGASPKGTVSLHTAFYCPTPYNTEQKPPPCKDDNPLNEFVLYALPYDFHVRADSKSDMLDWISALQQLS